MKDTFVSARLIAKDTIRLSVFTEAPFDHRSPKLLIDRHEEVKLNENRIITLNNLRLIDYKLKAPLELGHSYFLLIESIGQIPLDVSESTSFHGFDDEFGYDGDDLGCLCSKKETSFALWAPLASSVILKIAKPDGEESLLEMKRGDKGVYRLTLKGDYHGARYVYFVTNNENVSSSIDPYAKCSGPNALYSVACDFSRIKKYPKNTEKLSDYGAYSDAIIYETSVRDMTIDKHTDIVHKGTFKGLSEKGRKADCGLPAGMDYLKSLGVSHVQLLPIYDFKTVDEENPQSGYNWGYDPCQYFVPEGSFASNVKDPFNRIEECQELISRFHEEGMRVVMDVVYNHVYEYLSSSFEKVVPNYYFRRLHNGKMANTSYCGDDVASERKMVRKLIVDSALWWIDYYDVDGFRFDLMGILDLETVKEIQEKALARKKDFIIYGEGWNMGGEVSFPMARMDNSFVMPGIGFFNDAFREAVKEYVAEERLDDRFFASIRGSSMSFGSYPRRFIEPSQSINYVECHDNATFFDFMSMRRGDLDVSERLMACRLALSLIMTVPGIAFVHAGEEIGQSKFGKDNTYNLGDVYNQFSYKLLSERKEMYNYLRSLIALRKECPFLRPNDNKRIARSSEIGIENGLLIVQIESSEKGKEGTFVLIYNPTSSNVSYDFGEDVLLYFGSGGLVYKAGRKVQSALISPYGFNAFFEPSSN